MGLFMTENNTVIDIDDIRRIVAEEVKRQASDLSNVAGQREVITADEVAEFLGVDRNTVYDYANRGQIPHQRLGRRLLFSRSALLVGWAHASERRARKE